VEPISRRSLLKGLGAAGAGVAIASCSSSAKKGAAPKPTGGSTTTTNPYPPTSLPSVLRKPGSRPNPTLPEGTDTLPKIEHVVVMMQENHSYDGYFGMLGRGDGFKLGANGKPLDANPDGKGNMVKAFHMPSDCQLHSVPGQDWKRSHTSWNRGKNDGFVAASTAVAMGYWDESNLPFYYSLARTFPLCDRWFCSTLAQTYPNRRFMLAGTASGTTTTTGAALTVPAANGTIMDRLDAHGITFRDYYTDAPGMGVILPSLGKFSSHIAKIDQFYADAAAGKLPAVSFVDPNFEEQSEENPQDIAQGEDFSAKVINAVMNGPGWEKTVLIWTYDEHGGYYDHVAPPPAVRPDNIAPGVEAPAPGGFSYDFLGFRVPAVIVSPYAKRNYVSHIVHDHTSILKFIETKWNLGALTYRDANADDLMDALDFVGAPAFAEPPQLTAAGAAGTCTPGNVGGPIPPADAVVPATTAGLRIGAT
jgi:phospholipase C